MRKHPRKLYRRHLEQRPGRGLALRDTDTGPDEISSAYLAEKQQALRFFCEICSITFAVVLERNLGHPLKGNADVVKKSKKPLFLQHRTFSKAFGDRLMSIMLYES